MLARKTPGDKEMKSKESNLAPIRMPPECPEAGRNFHKKKINPSNRRQLSVRKGRFHGLLEADQIHISIPNTITHLVMSPPSSETTHIPEKSFHLNVRFFYAKTRPVGRNAGFTFFRSTALSRN
jgi:hypothetical protein